MAGPASICYVERCCGARSPLFIKSNGEPLCPRVDSEASLRRCDPNGAPHDLPQRRIVPAGVAEVQPARHAVQRLPRDAPLLATAARSPAAAATAAAAL